MPRSPADNQQIKDARRIDILRAATRVFAKKGFADAKISDVAKEAGLSHGLVYHYFENKDAVFRAILEDKLETARRSMDEDDSLPGTALDRMRTSLGRWLDRVRAEPETSILITRALVEGTLAPEVRAMMRVHMRESYESAIARIQEGQARGDIGSHASAEELASSLMCFMRGLALSTMIDFGVEFRVPSVDTLARLMVPGELLASLPTTSLPTTSARAPARVRATRKDVRKPPPKTLERSSRPKRKAAR